MEVESPFDYHIINENQVSNLWTCPNFLNSTWKPANGELPTLHQFLGQPGFNVEISDSRPITYYQLFVTDDLLHHLVVQTNLFAQQFIETRRNIPKYSYVCFWNPTTLSEMKKFLGLILTMGLVHKPATHFYWSTDKIFQTPVFNAVMSRNRFNSLLKFFHINDNQNLPNPNDPNQDRLYKLRPVIEELFEKFQSVYTPNQYIAVDESLLLWKGRLIFKQYLPLKRARFRIKLFCLCEDSGYMYRFRIYTGKQTPTDAIDIQLPEECKSFNNTEKIVVYMMLPLLNKGYTIWMDNWYSFHVGFSTFCTTMEQQHVEQFDQIAFH